MERILRNVSATLTETIRDGNGVATDPSPDTATVTITRADGTAVVTSAAATEAGVGKFTYTLTPAQTALLDTLTVTWAFTMGGQVQTIVSTVEVVGGFHFTISELRASDSQLANTLTYLTEDLQDMRTAVENEVELASNETAFVPRYSYLTTRVRDGWMRLPNMTTKIRSVSVNGVAWTSGQLAAFTYAGGLPRYGSGFWYDGDYTVGVEHGYSACPPEISRYSKALARKRVLAPTDMGGFTTVSSPDGSFSAAVAEPPDSIFGMRDADRVIRAYRVPQI